MSQNSVLNVFLEQTYSQHGGIENYEKYCNEILSKKEEKQNKYVLEAMEKLSSDQTISNYIDIPSQLTEKDINSVTEEHTLLKGYDHSLEKNRLHDLLDKYDADMEDICPKNSGFTQNKLSPEKISQEDIDNAPDLSGLFDGVFNL